MPQKMIRFFRELKRRKIYRVATVYAITGWIIVEVTDTIFPHLGLPGWLVTSIIVVILAGFPVAMILAWIYEMGPKGIIRTSTADAVENPLPETIKKPFTGTLTILILSVILVGQFVYFTFIRNNKTDLLPEEVLSEKVAVAPFNNFTGEESLNAFGLMASEWITSGLRELSVKTSSPEMMRKYRDNVGILPGNPGEEASLFELTGAKYVVTGSYYRNGNQVEVSSRLESTETGDVIYNFPSLKGYLDQKEALVDEIRERVKGYWAVKEAEDLSIFHPPKYEAYQALMESDGDPSDYYGHLRALELDSTFMLARVYLYHSSVVWDMDSVHAATGRYIRDHWNECTAYEKNYVNFVENVKRHRYEAAARELDKNIALDSRDLSSIHESAHFWLGVNRPEETVLHYQDLFEHYDLYGKSLNVNMYRNYFDALNRLGRQKEVIRLSEIFEAEDYFRMGWHGRTQLVRSFLMEEEWDKLEAVLEIFRENNILDYDKYARVYNEIFPQDTANYFGAGLSENLDRYTDPEDSWYYVTSTFLYLVNGRSRANMLYILKDFDRAEEILIELRSVNWEEFLSDEHLKRDAWQMKIWVEGLLGSCYARQGKMKEALNQLTVLDALHPEEPNHMNRMRKGALPYYQARIYAILGDQEQAVDKLRQSMEEGRMSEQDCFVNDWDLASLKGYEPYRKLVNLPQ
jgi:TolB-like protein